MYSGSLVAPWKIGQKTNSIVWLPRNLFYGKSISMFGLFKHFTENMKCLTKETLALPRRTCNSTKKSSTSTSTKSI